MVGIKERTCGILVGIALLFAVSGLWGTAAGETIVCPECGYVNDWSDAFCVNCGASLREAKAEAERKAEEAEAAAEPEQVAEPQVVEETATAEPPKQLEERSPGPIYTGPVDPRRLFIVPVAEPLGSMEVNLGGGSAFGVSKTEKRPLLGHIGIGLGDVAEVELSTVGIINRLSEGSASIPTAAFKLKVLSEGRVRPAVAGALRSSLWHSEQRGNVKFEKRLSTLYVVASKSFGALSLHTGLSVNDLRIRTKDARTDTLISPVRGASKDYHNRNPVGPFFGLRAEVNPKTFLMLEVEEIAEYEFDEDNPELSEDDISTEWMVIAGVRFFFVDWLALDSGVMYRSDYHGIGDAQIEAGLNINLPLPRMIRSTRSSAGK